MININNNSSSSSSNNNNKIFERKFVSLPGLEP